MTVSSDDRAYRRGIVLGFTVAEVVLLIVFCLLLLFVPLLLSEAAQKEAATPPPAPFLRAGGAATGMPGADGGLTAPKRKGDLGSAAQQTKPQPTKPLPDDWITATPDRDNEAVRPIEPGSKAGSSSPPTDTTRHPVPIPAPVVAISVASICKKLGISERDCTVERADAALLAAAPKPAPSPTDPKADGPGVHNWPPIIRLKEADGEFFVVGKAEVSRTLEEKIRREVVLSVLQLATRYQTNVVEVVGHTDEQPIQAAQTNLDGIVFDVLAGKAPASRLRVSDNAGLGFARAVAIVQILRADERLKHLTILPLSAAQVVDQDGRLTDGSRSGDVKERRRIEIRVRQGEPPS